MGSQAPSAIAYRLNTSLLLEATSSWHPDGDLSETAASDRSVFARSLPAYTRHRLRYSRPLSLWIKIIICRSWARIILVVWSAGGSTDFSGSSAQGCHVQAGHTDATLLHPPVCRGPCKIGQSRRLTDFGSKRHPREQPKAAAATLAFGQCDMVRVPASSTSTRPSLDTTAQRRLRAGGRTLVRNHPVLTRDSPSLPA